MRFSDLAAVPVLRLVRYAFEQFFGEEPATLWQAPGGLVLLDDGDARLSVAVRWGAVVAARPRRDDLIVLASMNSPGERIEIPLASLAAGGADAQGQPAWAAGAIRATAALQRETADGPPAGWAAGAPQTGTAAGPPQTGPADGLAAASSPNGRAVAHGVTGVSMLIHDDLPESSSLASPASVATAALLALADVSGLDLAPAAAAALLPASGAWDATPLLARGATALMTTAGGAFAGSVPFDLEAAGLRLLLADCAAPPGARRGPDAARSASFGPRQDGAGPGNNGAGPGPDGDRDPATDGASRITPEPADAAPGPGEPGAGPGASSVRAAADCLREHGPAALGLFLENGSAGHHHHTSQNGRGALSAVGRGAVVRAAVAHGALGAWTAQGRPGLVAALVPVPALSAVRQAVARAFLHQGGRRPHILSTVAANGAHRAA